jgi:hypothetical protein
VFKLQANRLGGGGQCVVTAALSATQDLEFAVYRYPVASEVAYKPSTNIIASGVRIAADANSSMTSTSATYEVVDDSDFENDKTHFGSAIVTADASNMGFKMPVVPAGTYALYARGWFGVLRADSSTACSIGISDDGGTTIYSGAKVSQATTNSIYDSTSFILGTVTYTSLQSNKEFSVYIKRSAGGGNCYTDANNSAEVGIIPLTQSIPMPQILNNVESSASGGVRTCSGRIESDGTATVLTEEGNCIASLADVGTGHVQVNFTTGTFSGVPACTCTAEENVHGDVYCKHGMVATADAVRFKTMRTTTQALQSEYVAFTCIGDK